MPHTTGRLEAGFYTEVTHRADHQPAAAGHQSGRSPISYGCGEDDVTRTAWYSHTRHKQGPMGTEQGRMGRTARVPGSR
uniref:Uncharacterized protein n=1 Tax=Mus spicilegus TaxID=10103 RepID=A0A8C6GZH7_MUSSI